MRRIPRAYKLHRRAVDRETIVVSHSIDSILPRFDLISFLIFNLLTILTNGLEYLIKKKKKIFFLKLRVEFRLDSENQFI